MFSITRRCLLSSSILKYTEASSGVALPVIKARRMSLTFIASDLTPSGINWSVIRANAPTVCPVILVRAPANINSKPLPNGPLKGILTLEPNQ